MCSEYQTQISHPLRFASSVKACRRMGKARRCISKQVYRNSEVRRSGVRCAAGCCIKSVKKCISRARAPRGRDAWAALIDIKSDSPRGWYANQLLISSL